MKKSFLGALILGIAFLGLTSIANATVLTFEDLTNSEAAPIPAGYGGFNWDSGWYLYNDDIYPNPAHSGHYGIVNNFGNDPLGLQISSDSSFDFNGAWVSGWSFNSPQVLKAQGFDQFGNLLAETAWLEIAVGVNSYLQADFAGVYRVNFVGGQYFTIDDFTFNENQKPVPEPASIFLIGTGIVGLMGARRRKKE